MSNLKCGDAVFFKSKHEDKILRGNIIKQTDTGGFIVEDEDHYEWCIGADAFMSPEEVCARTICE